jgi:hypothetical protein
MSTRQPWRNLHSQYPYWLCQAVRERHGGVMPLFALLSLSCLALYSGLILTGGDIQGRLPFGIFSYFPTTSACHEEATGRRAPLALLIAYRLPSGSIVFVWPRIFLRFPSALSMIHANHADAWHSSAKLSSQCASGHVEIAYDLAQFRHSQCAE